MFAGEIAYLAVLGVAHVAGVVLAAVGVVEVAHCGGAVAVAGHGEVVDVVHEWAVGADVGEVGEVEGECYAGT